MVVSVPGGDESGLLHGTIFYFPLDFFYICVSVLIKEKCNSDMFGVYEIHEVVEHFTNGERVVRSGLL